MNTETQTSSTGMSHWHPRSAASQYSDTRNRDTRDSRGAGSLPTPNGGKRSFSYITEDMISGSPLPTGIHNPNYASTTMKDSVPPSAPSRTSSFDTSGYHYVSDRSSLADSHAPPCTPPISGSRSNAQVRHPDDGATTHSSPIVPKSYAASKTNWVPPKPESAPTASSACSRLSCDCGGRKRSDTVTKDDLLERLSELRAWAMEANYKRQQAVTENQRLRKENAESRLRLCDMQTTANSTFNALRISLDAAVSALQTEHVKNMATAMRDAHAAGVAEGARSVHRYPGESWKTMRPAPPDHTVGRRFYKDESDPSGSGSGVGSSAGHGDQ